MTLETEPQRRPASSGLDLTIREMAEQRVEYWAEMLGLRSVLVSITWLQCASVYIAVNIRRVSAVVALC
jgi:hypothetical protein